MDFLQNLWIQIALGFVPALLFAIILLFAKKVKSMAYITLITSLCVICVCGSVFGVMELSSEKEVKETKEEEETPVEVLMTQEDIQDLAYSFLRVGDIENAERMVNLYSKQFGYDDKCALITARIAVIDQKYDRALGVYKKLYGDILPEEAEAVEMIVEYRRNDNVLYEELNAEGLAPDKQIDEQKVQNLISGGAADLVFKEMDKENLGSKREPAAQWVSDVDNLFKNFVDKDIFDEVRLNELVEESKKHYSDSAFETTEIYREARVKLLLVAGRFSDIAANLDEYSGNSEYLTTLELYLNGKVGKTELERVMGLEEIKGASTLLTQLKHIRNNNKDLTEEEIAELDKQIAALESDGNRVLREFENKILDMAQDEDNRTSASKMYMSLANISSKLGEDGKHKQYLSDALETAPDSDDDAYSSAMNDLSNIISGNGDSDDIKNIGDNSLSAAENSFYIPDSGKIIRNETVLEQQTESIQDYALKAKAAITINSVDASNFEEIQIKVQVSDEFLNGRDLASILNLTDCNYEITDFKVEKVEYQKANIILICDNSGSMSGSVGSLRNAVNKFLETSNEKETIGFYTFDDTIIQSYPLGTATREELANAVNSMGAHGGTNIFGTLKSVLESTSNVSDANQAIILMTDGQDGYYGNDNINETISNLATQKGYIVYVLGMGDSVEIDYLSGIANAGGGQFIYAPTDAQLESLYEFIHGTLKNQYLITFNAKDTITANGREVVISIDEMVDTAIYHLTDSDTEDAFVEFDHGVSVSGLSERLIYKEKENVDVFVTGTNFKANDYMSVKLIGERKYTLTTTYVNDTSFKVTIPNGIALGEYDVEIDLSGRKALFLNELNVVEGEPDEVQFGQYSFKAFKIKESHGQIELSSNVVMNGWLNFNGEITLDGELDDYQIYLYDKYGSHVNYSETSHGLAQKLAKEGKTLNIPALGNLKLINAASYSGDYPTESQGISHLTLPEIATFQYPSIRLYPDKITVDIDHGITELPLVEYFISTRKGTTNPFSFDCEIEGTITGQNMDIKGDINFGFLEENQGYVNTVAADILGMRGTLQKDALKFKFNTLHNEIYFGVNVKIPNFDEWFGFSASYKNGHLDSIEMAADVDVKGVFAGIPVTYNDFKLGLSDIASFWEVNTPADAAKLALNLSLTMEAGQVSEKFPALKKYVGDVSLASVDAKGTISCGTSIFSAGLTANASLKFLNLVEVANAEFALGEFSYSNVLLGIDDENVHGLMLGLGVGLNMEAKNFKINLTGSECDFMFTDRFLGVDTNCVADLELNWWGPDLKFHTNGQNLAGLFKTDSGESQFTVRSSEVKNGKRVGLLFYKTIGGDSFYDGNYKY